MMQTIHDIALYVLIFACGMLCGYMLKVVICIHGDCPLGTFKLNPLNLYLGMDVTYDQKTQKYIRR